MLSGLYSLVRIGCTCRAVGKSAFWRGRAERGRIAPGPDAHMAMRYSHLAPDFTLEAVKRMQAEFQMKNE